VKRKTNTEEEKMKERLSTLLVIILFAVILTGCGTTGATGTAGAQGPTGDAGDPGNTGTQGPTGNAGQNGTSIYVYQTTGILYSANLISSSYWDISYWAIPASAGAIVQVYVRLGSGYLWKIPNYYVSYNAGYVRIFDDTITDPAHEYMILVAKNQSSLKQYKTLNNLQ
jgi:hypothetical protein